MKKKKAFLCLLLLTLVTSNIAIPTSKCYQNNYRTFWNEEDVLIWSTDFCNGQVTWEVYSSDPGLYRLFFYDGFRVIQLAEQYDWVFFSKVT